MKKIFPLLKSTGSIYVYCDDSTISTVKKVMEKFLQSPSNNALSKAPSTSVLWCFGAPQMTSSDLWSDMDDALFQSQDPSIKEADNYTIKIVLGDPNHRQQSKNYLLVGRHAVVINKN